MAKKLEKKLLSSAMAVALAAGIGFSGSASAIHLAEDGIGQVLLAPYYTTQGGYKTKFAVVNTRTDVAVKAKVVLRSKAHSTEVLDFICYLSPGDVCRFEVRADANGQAELFSDDDSIRSKFSPVTFASQEAGDLPVRLFDQRMLAIDPNDINEVGHVEIIGAYAAMGNVWVEDSNNNGIPDAGEVVNVRIGMPKHELARIFDKPRAQLNNLNGTEVVADGRVYNNGCVAYNANSAQEAGAPCSTTGAPVNVANIRSTDPNVVRLTGTVEIVKNDNSDRYGYQIPALAGELWDNVHSGVIDPRTLSMFDGRVITNPFFDVTVAQETSIGVGFPAFGDNIYEIEYALATSNIMSTYEDDGASGTGLNQTDVLVTFPTKYRHRINHVCTAQAPSLDELRYAWYTPPFETNGSIQYSLMPYNNQEGFPSAPISGDIFSGAAPTEIARNFLFAEVNYMTPNWPYNSGWFNMTLIPRVGCAYSGVPSLAMTYKWMNVNGNVMNSMATPAAHIPEYSNIRFDPVPAGNDMGL
jgi:hypothetical protein